MDMRTWCAAVAVGALFALPLFAQQKDEGATKSAVEANAEAPAAPAPSIPVSRSGVFAVPAIPRTTPFPGPQAATASKEVKDTRPPGRLVPKFEVTGGYSYVNFMPGEGFDNFNS